MTALRVLVVIAVSLPAGVTQALDLPADSTRLVLPDPTDVEGATGLPRSSWGRHLRVGLTMALVKTTLSMFCSGACGRLDTTASRDSWLSAIEMEGHWFVSSELAFGIWVGAWPTLESRNTIPADLGWAHTDGVQSLWTLGRGDFTVPIVFGIGQLWWHPGKALSRQVTGSDSALTGSQGMFARLGIGLRLRVGDSFVSGGARIDTGPFVPATDSQGHSASLRLDAPRGFWLAFAF